jgi:hypothetical protein
VEDLQRHPAKHSEQYYHISTALRQLAQVFLKRHGVIVADGQIVSPTVSKLSLRQKAHIRMLCGQRLQSFVQKRGIGIWDTVSSMKSRFR